MSLSGEVSEQQERSLSGPILSVDVPHWKKKNKRDGSAFSGYNARAFHVIRVDAYTPMFLYQ